MKARWRMVGALVLAFAAAPVLAIDLGDPAPPLKIKEWVKGKPVNLKEAKGKNIVVVEFWATWCPFCKKQNPYLQRLHQEHGGKDLVVLTFSIDKAPEAVAAYMMEHDYTFAAAMAGAQSARWFPKRKGLPVVYVVDRSGRIVFDEAGELFEEDILGLARFAGHK